MMDTVEDESFDKDAIMQQWAQEAEEGQPSGEIDINQVDDWEDVNGN